MPRPDAERLAEFLWLRLRPALVGMLDMALADQDDPALAADAGTSDAESAYIAQRVAAQLQKYRALGARPRSATNTSSRRRKA